MSIAVNQLSKIFQNQRVVDNVSLEVAEGELFVLLGPSGSGKSMILRMISGLLTPDGGRILLRGTDVTNLSPQQRGTGFLFQNYSVFRHMTVADNIEFGLKIRGVGDQERATRRERLLDLVGLAGLGSRYPAQLSGGQQQRVALARALAYEPSVLLLDEPFGALDVKTRSQLRRGFKEIQKRLRVTTLLVTHDQEEAFELADRIGVIEHGRLLEVGRPETLYLHPKTLFTATFLGTGTVLAGWAENGLGIFGPLRFPLPSHVTFENGDRVQILFRPEEIHLSCEKPSQENQILGLGEITDRDFAGASWRVRLRLPHLSGTRQIAPVLPFGEESLLVDAVMPVGASLPSLPLWVSLKTWHILEPAPFRILVCDPACEPAPVLDAAALFSEKLRAASTLLAVAKTQDGTESLHAALLERRSRHGLEGSEIRVRYGEMAAQILSEQATGLYELVVVAASDDPVSRPNQLSATLLKILQHSDIPLLVIKGESKSLRNILICTAAGEPGKTNVRVGGRLARRLSCRATLLYVMPSGGESSPLVLSHLDRATATLRTLDVQSDTRVITSTRLAEAILTEARQAACDLIVVGSHVPRGNSRLGPETVTAQVLAGADRPVLVVPGEEM